MTLPLKIATIALKVALLVALVSGLCLIWIPSANNYRQLEALRNVVWSSAVVIVVTGMYVVACGVVAQIQRDSKYDSTPPRDQ